MPDDARYKLTPLDKVVTAALGMGIVTCCVVHHYMPGVWQSMAQQHVERAPKMLASVAPYMVGLVYIISPSRMAEGQFKKLQQKGKTIKQAATRTLTTCAILQMAAIGAALWQQNHLRQNPPEHIATAPVPR